MARNNFSTILRGHESGLCHHGAHVLQLSEHRAFITVHTGRTEEKLQRAAVLRVAADSVITEHSWAGGRWDEKEGRWTSVSNISVCAWQCSCTSHCRNDRDSDNALRLLPQAHTSKR